MRRGLLGGVALGLLAALAPRAAWACPGCMGGGGNGAYLAATVILLFVPLVMLAVFVTWIRCSPAGVDAEPAAGARPVRRGPDVSGALGPLALLLLSLAQLC